MTQLLGKRALVTGGSREIGAAAAALERQPIRLSFCCCDLRILLDLRLVFSCGIRDNRL
jgi:hypothetical protein